MHVVAPDMDVAPHTLVELLRWRASRQPQQHAYAFLLDGERDRAELTYGDLERRAQAIGAALQAIGAAGERVLLLYPPGLDYIAAFFGCLYAGAIAVPAYPPDPARIDRTLPRLHAIVADARPMALLTTTPILALAGALAGLDSSFQAMRWIATDAVADDAAVAWSAPALSPTSPAFLQYTSGSTAAPKGVILTHGNLLHNSSLIARAFEHSPSSVGVIWLPPYHDMGLIGGIVQPLYAGFPVVLMSPIAFLQRPLRWLEAVSRERATTSGGPNFAYDLCVRKVTPDQLAALDLSSWSIAFNGAEPIRAETLDRFAATFAPCGFRRTAFFPCYGLAEATLIVSGVPAAAPPTVRTFHAAALDRRRAVEVAGDPPGGRRLVGCGQALAGQRLVVVDPETCGRCQPGQIGEIWVGGPSVAQGYWGRAEETAASFGARVADTGEGPLLRTGDLGFVQGDELFITGRLKDLIIIRGRNLYPQDIELTAERAHAALRPGSGAAFAVEQDGEERLVVVQEVAGQLARADLAAVAAAIRQAVAEQHDLHTYAVALIKPGSIPKTSSGKIQRHACRARFLDGGLELVASSTLDEAEAPAGGWRLRGADLLAVPPDGRGPLLTAWLCEQLAGALRLAAAQLDPRRPVGALGLDSLMAIDLQHAIESQIGVVVPMVDFLGERSIADLADAILARLPASAAPAAGPPEPADSAPATVPLSFGQRALWFLHQIAPASAAYTIARGVRLRGALDAGALQRAFQALVDRHPALRTTFAQQGDEPAQLVHPHAAVCFAVLDAASWDDAAVDGHLAAEAARPFDLTCGPLLRVSLLRRSAHEHILLLVAHHLVVDLWSMVVLTHELGERYAAEQAGGAAPLRPGPARYADYVRWQAALLDGAEGQRLWEYWRRQLEGAPVALDLPTDRPRPPIQTYRGAAQAFHLSAALAGALKGLARDAGATLYMTLLAAFQALLARYTGQTDLLVGSVTTGRSRAEWAEVVGYFVNPVALRADVSGNPTFLELLGRARRATLAALAHQDYPFTLLVERLQPERDPSRSPLFQVMFVVQKAQLHDEADLTAFALEAGDARMRLGGLEVEAITLEQPAAQFDLTLALADAADGIAGSLHYNADLFEAATVARMAGHLQTLLAGVVADPGQRLADLPLLTAAEQEQLLRWNATAAAFPRERCAHELFAEQAARAPDALALSFEQPSAGRPTDDARASGSAVQAHLTYRELDARASQLARALRRLGVGPEVPVALRMERSPELVIAILGVHKAGGAYVPLDPASPAERIAFMLDDVAAPVLLTTNDHRPPTTDRWVPIDDCRSTNAERFTTERMETTEREEDRAPIAGLTILVRPAPQHPAPDTQHPALVCPEPHPPTPEPRTPTPEPASPLVRRDAQPLTPNTQHPTPDTLAYVIYTSGSTGQPKGVQVEHRGLLNLVCWHWRAFDVTPQDRATQVADPSFDAMVWEIWPYLTAGASIHIPSAATRLAPAGLRDWLVAQAISVCFLPTPLAEQVLPLDWPTGAALRALLTGGDFLHHGPPPTLPFALVNNYGPTESSVVATSGPVLPAGQDDRPPAIGRPIANTQVYLLDRALRLVPIGVAGELCIGGAGLARGYLGRPDLTAERFIPNPFAQVLGDGGQVLGDDSANTQHPTPNTRLYRTGDLARFRADGAIEFLGRLDAQVKIRGYRIELGEVEALLGQHPGVREAAVVVREVAPGDARLVAYVVPTADQRPTTNDQRASGAAAVDSVPDGALPRSIDAHEARSTHRSELVAFLRDRLPGYMVPAAVVLLDALPLTPSGKLDRRALPAPAVEAAGAGAPPRTETEAELAQIWAELLRVPQVGVHDDFFALGGHSLLAARVLARASERFGLALPMQTLFEAPTVAGLAAQIEAAQRTPAAALPPIEPAARGAPLPLSYGQQSLWVLAQLRPESVVYNVPAALRLRGPLDVPALRWGLQTIVTRHEALRSTFVQIDGQPMQLVARHLALRVLVLDLTGLAAPAREAALARLLAREARQPFDLARGPLLRATLLRLAADAHALLLTAHHIVIDGRSIGVFMRELAACYGARAAGGAAVLPALPVQYADYALWQRRWLRGARLAALLAYWRQQLADLPALDLPLDRPRPASVSFRGATCTFTLPAELRAALVALCQREEVTLYMALLAAFQALLARYSRQDDIVVGTPVSANTRAELAPLIGCFVNTLVLRGDLSGRPSFRELLRRVRAVTQAAFAHQDLPFELLVEDLRPVRDTVRTPLFQVMFALEVFAGQDWGLADVAAEPIAVETGTAKFDLMLVVRDQGEVLAGTFEYATDVFDAATVGRMGQHLELLLRAAVAESGRPVAELPLLTAAERALLLRWNATAAAFPRERCVHELLAEQAARAPDAMALLFERPADRAPLTPERDGDRALMPRALPAGLRSAAPAVEQLTYGALDRRASQLACSLRSLGVGPEVRVGVCLERTPELVVALLAVLKAGGAYVPLDPAYPAERLAFMLDDSGAAVLVTTADHRPPTTDQWVTSDARRATAAERLTTEITETTEGSGDDASSTDLTILMRPDSQHPTPNTQHPALVRRDAQPLTPNTQHPTPGNLAYVIYTSGSTGTPKGVAITHRSVVAMLAWARGVYAPEQLAGVLAATSVCFDLSVFELFVPLCWGGMVVLAEHVLQLPTMRAAADITLINTVPSALAEVLRAGAVPASARTINLAGEALPLFLVRQLYQQGHVREVVNLYGPSEDTTYSTFAVIARDSEAPPPIGRPIANTQVYLLDRALQPVPIGVAGELCIAGAGLARGYLGRPDLTAERFIPNPFGQGMGDGGWGMGDEDPTTQHPTPNTRLYRTGDLARFREDGAIEFLGRLDAQVKIRGYRVEPGEIEALLRQHPAVRAAVVLVREDAPGDARLVAYVVPTNDQRPTTNDQRPTDADAVESVSDAAPPGVTAPWRSLSTHHSVLSTRYSELIAFLRERLPGYMVPAVVLLDALPLTPSGKLDRRALPAPQVAVGVGAPPRSETEAALAGIWAELLHVPQVGVHDDFFALGGHSLLAARVLARTSERFGLALPMQTLFEAPTVAGLARSIEMVRWAVAGQQAAADRVEDREEGLL